MMQNMRWKTLFFYVFCVGVTSLLCHVAVDAQGEIKSNQKDNTRINTNFMKVNEKIDFLSEKIEALELNSSTGNHAISQILIALTELNKKSDEFNKKSEELNKSNKEILKMKELLMELIHTDNQQKKMRHRTTKSDVIDEMTSQCTSFCEAKINVWANETSDKFTEDLRVEKLDFNVKNSTFKTCVNACEPNPCFNGGQCELSYRCTKCPYLTSGSHCETLNCNKANKCFQYRSSMYVVFEKNVDWATASNICSKVGMHLAQLKDRDTSEAVISQLRIMPIPKGPIHFWIGLKPNGSEWLWVDGTPLGTYTGGVVNFKANLGERWGLVYLHHPGITWHPRILANVAKYIHYPLCEKRIYTRY